MLQTTFEPPLAFITLNDPARRNALGTAMFDALDAAIAAIKAHDDIDIVLLRGEGNVFCTGFDLTAATNDPELMGRFIWRLSTVNRGLRRMPQIVIAAVQGAAIAGGCALLTACDFVVASRQARFGYPVHRIGVSPAVTIPTLLQTIGGGAARALLMSGDMIDAVEAHRTDLVTHLSESDETVGSDALEHARRLAEKGRHALRITKSWLNELDGSLDDARFDGPAAASAAICSSSEATSLLARWRASHPDTKSS